MIPDAETIRTNAAQLQKQIDASNNTLSEISALLKSTQATNEKTTEANTIAIAALESIRAAQATATEASTRAEAIKTQIEQAAAVSAARSAHIEEGRIHADDIRNKINIILTQAAQSATNAEAQHQASLEALSTIQKLSAEALASKSTVEQHSEVITGLKTQSEKYTSEMKALSEAAAGMEAHINAAESRLVALTGEAANQLKTIDNLLVGATNAGLAHAFDKRSQTFRGPEKFWQAMFALALLGLFILAIVEACTFNNMSKVPEFSEMARMLLHRLPFLIPLVWLAVYATRQASFAKKMEEEYAFKATISTSFEGYRRQMAEIGKDLSPASPLSQLCNDTLRTIANPPGQLYEKQRMDPTPGTAAAEFMKPIMDGVTKAIEAKLPSLPKA